MTSMAGTLQPSVLPAARIPRLLWDYAELTKARITSLILMMAWSGYFFGAHKSGSSVLSADPVHTYLLLPRFPSFV
jgi:heme O synthase-like polyprenyltransferase